MSETPLKTKLAWQCRRGMLELDVILIPFLEQHFESLNNRQQGLFVNLLEQADPDIYTWIMGFGKVSDEGLTEIVALIVEKMKLHQ